MSKKGNKNDSESEETTEVLMRRLIEELETNPAAGLTKTVAGLTRSVQLCNSKIERLASTVENLCLAVEMMMTQQDDKNDAPTDLHEEEEEECEFCDKHEEGEVVKFTLPSNPNDIN